MKHNDPFLTSSQRLWLMALAALWALFLFGSFLFGAPDDTNIHRMPTWTLMSSSFTLVVAAWSWFVFSRKQPFNRYALLISLGMVFGFLGDLFLASVLPAPNRVLTCIGTFAVGHVFYTLTIAGFGSRFNLNGRATR